MNTKLVVAMAMALLGVSPAFAGEKTDATLDKMKAAVTPGEFDLTGKEVKTIHHGSSAKEYKVCVKPGEETASMKVRHDDQETIVQPGDCADISGKTINATAAEPLTGSRHIMATYHAVKE